MYGTFECQASGTFVGSIDWIRNERAAGIGR
jgi:hypothetical protein